MSTGNAQQSATTWTDSDTATAKRIWEEYQQTHDVTALGGQAAGIDPKTGEVWIGEDILDIALLRKSQGQTSPLFFARVGAETFYTKGWRA